MAWYDSLDNIDWGGMVTRAVPAVVGSLISSNANQRAAETVANATNSYAALQRQAQADAQARLDAVAKQGAPAVSYLQNVVARPPGELTPQQQNYVSDVRRQTGNQLSSRLGGRSATAIATKSASDIYGNTVAANQARSDNAAGTLAGRNMQASMTSAQVPMTTAQNVGAANVNAANTIGQGQVATGAQQAQTLGDIVTPKSDILNALSSFIANDRKSSYQRPAFAGG